MFFLSEVVRKSSEVGTDSFISAGGESAISLGAD